MQHILILGIGNPLMGDDGIGPYAAEVLQQEDLPPGIDIRNVETGLHDLDLLVADADHIIILDAVRTGQAPGTVIRMTESDLASILPARLSLHGAGLAEALAMAQLERGNKPPPSCTVVGMEIEQVEPGIGFSEPVLNNMHNYLETIRAAIAATSG